MPTISRAETTLGCSEPAPNDMPRLSRAFYARNTLCVARELLGQRLVRAWAGQRISGRIVEVEAYIGQDDAACHASRGRTARNAVMFGPPGHAYVYFIYGMHYCFNVVTEQEGFAAAVLVRALQPIEGLGIMRSRRRNQSDDWLTNGPAKLCAALAIDRALNGVDLVTGSELWVEEDDRLADAQVSTGVRIGVRGDQRALTVPWRLWVKDSSYVSRR
jgi:DNA-3-methyladenine glycosylase